MHLTSLIVVLLSSLLLMLLLLHKRLVFFVQTSIHDSPYHACISHLITMLFFETWSEGILLHLFRDLPTDYQMVYVRTFIHPFEMCEILFKILSEIVRNS